MSCSPVVVRVEPGDALSRAGELLVVKHAQASYGLDARIVEALAIPRSMLPAPGSHVLVSGLGRIGATRVMFLGVGDLYQLEYRDVREIGRRAVSTPARALPQVREICVTLHGPGLGLDEVEAFEAEVAGLVDAVRSGTVPPGLQKVTFLEHDLRRADRMAGLLTRLLPDHRIQDSPLVGEVAGASVERLRSAGHDSGAKGHALVAMPFAPSFEDIFHYGIAPPIRNAGLLCERIDQVVFTGDVVSRLKERIADARFVVADVTGANANVYLEVGYAWGRDVPVILVCGDTTELKFDIQGQRCVFYGSIRELETKLAKEIAPHTGPPGG